MFDDMGAVLAMLLFLTAFVVLLSGFPVAFALGGTAVIFAFLGMLSGDFVWGMMSSVAGRMIDLMTNETLVAVRSDNLVGFGNSALHALGAGGEDDLGAEHAQKHAAFLRHRLGHREDQFVAAGSADKGESDAGVTGGRLDDDRVGLDFSGRFAGFDHGFADTILDAGEGVEELGFDVDVRVQTGGDPVQFDERGIADGRDNVVKDK